MMSEQAIAEKSKVVAELKEKIARASVMVLADYLGLSVKEMTELRRKLRAEKSELAVIKNTLIERAVAESGLPEFKDHLKGPTVVMLGYADAVSPLKALVKFIKETEKGGLRIGVVDKQVFSRDDLAAISKLPPREVLLGKVVGGLKSPLYGLANVLNGPLRKLVYALNAIKDKKG
ncbi:50S ribosomal protein L10 [candidate division WOR-1 bacterium RIFCSPHIGHO2_01_FULL_53_15]|uniref:Large ribosomal subunit protein uL10 n=1 Tax=candidate division WOR-1 bacterium RIFCSPHIGHO2_01_FULL_53_15 TaxID=1802564 RepID=A0A1F4Q3R1_UNCSA|nr:MAG: 50S ribosomal protein L10 [candidate division WOR-1 bacterium RIFCSPHIGHO2_01_FULL_53_15]OGC12523.1 MAG: 50S ribosomal protein L10 [candidate division WOR-1 bacterium RIFCSPHIGHO2_02_FULL_53_26]